MLNTRLLKQRITHGTHQYCLPTDPEIDEVSSISSGEFEEYPKRFEEEIVFLSQKGMFTIKEASELEEQSEAATTPRKGFINEILQEMNFGNK